MNKRDLLAVFLLAAASAAGVAPVFADEDVGFLTGEVAAADSSKLAALGLGVTVTAQDKDPSDRQSPGYLIFELRASDLFSDLIGRRTIQLQVDVTRDGRNVGTLYGSLSAEQTWIVACGYRVRLSLAARITYQWMKEGVLYSVDLDTGDTCTTE